MDKKKLVNQSIDYILQHLNENWSLNTLAAHLKKKPAGVSICKVDQSAIYMKLNPT